MRQYRDFTPILDRIPAGDDYLTELDKRIRDAQHGHARRYAVLNWINQ